jgi:hypothetical protein
MGRSTQRWNGDESVVERGRWHGTRALGNWVNIAMPSVRVIDGLVLR